MDFKFDVSQIPVIPVSLDHPGKREGSDESSTHTRSSFADVANSSWKKPQLSQVQIGQSPNGENLGLSHVWEGMEAVGGIG